MANPERKQQRQEKWGKVKDWLKTNAPKALDVVGDVLPDSGALGVIKNILDRDPDVSPEQQAQFDSMIKEMYELEVRDRESARAREVEVKKAGKQEGVVIGNIFAYYYGTSSQDRKK